MELPRVDKIGEELGLTHKINNNVLHSFKNAEKRIRYDWFYNTRDEIIYNWNKFLDKLKIKA